MLQVTRWFVWLILIGITESASAAPASQGGRPYIGFVYPAGGQQGTKFLVKIGGQGLGDVDRVHITGSGVRGRVIDYQRRLSPQDVTLLREQLNQLKKSGKKPSSTSKADQSTELLKAKLERRIADYVNRPACTSIANVTVIEVTMSGDAQPGEREIRLGTPSGISNPMVFYVGQIPEFSRPAMGTSEVQVLGKEELALRRRPTDEGTVRITLPCSVNGQVASGEIHRYRFRAQKGQQLVIVALARQLIPFIADAVPGWFQPVLTLYDSSGKEVAYVDDFRFKPDPMIIYKVPADGEYTFTINDSIYRGREDFVYRIAAGELPYVTSIYPLGARVGDPVSITMKGANLGDAKLEPPPKNASPGIQFLGGAKDEYTLNQVPFALDTLPEVRERESNDSHNSAQKVRMPVIINGRIDKSDDWDVYSFSGHLGETVVIEVMARRLDSPVDSILKLADSSGAVMAFNDDLEDPGSGINTHHADSYLSVKLPADGTYYVHMGDTSRSGGEEYGYRLRISPPQPDFALRVVPSSIALRGKSSASLSVHAIRKDGFTGPIALKLRNPPIGFYSSTVSMTGTQQVAQVSLRTSWTPPKDPVNFTLSLVGIARIDGRDVTHEAVPAEDRMQAFLWRHLVPAGDLRVEVFNPSYKPPPKRTPMLSTAAAAQMKLASSKSGEAKFTKRQVAGRLRDLKLLFEEGLLSNDFYLTKVAECEAAR